MREGSEFEISTQPSHLTPLQKGHGPLTHLKKLYLVYRLSHCGIVMLLILRTLEYATSYFTAILENWYSYKIYPDNG